MHNRSKLKTSAVQLDPAKNKVPQQKTKSVLTKLCLLFEILFVSFVALLVINATFHHFLLFEDTVNISEYQVSLNGTYVPFDGKKIFVQCGGPKNNNPVVFLVNGLGGILSDWTEIYEELTKKTHVCRYDPIGFGFSDVLEEPSQLIIEYSINQLRTIYNHFGMRFI